MATLTIRNLSPITVSSLKELARRNRRSMEQEIRDILERHAGHRLSAVEQIKRLWETQARSPFAEEIESWIREGRPLRAVVDTNDWHGGVSNIHFAEAATCADDRPPTGSLAARSEEVVAYLRRSSVMGCKRVHPG